MQTTVTLNDGTTLIYKDGILIQDGRLSDSVVGQIKEGKWQFNSPNDYYLFRKFIESRPENYDLQIMPISPPDDDINDFVISLSVFFFFLFVFGTFAALISLFL
jgi:hypothetical protein